MCFLISLKIEDIQSSSYHSLIRFIGHGSLWFHIGSQKAFSRSKLYPCRILQLLPLLVSWNKQSRKVAYRVLRRTRDRIQPLRSFRIDQSNLVLRFYYQTQQYEDYIFSLTICIGKRRVPVASIALTSLLRVLKRETDPCTQFHLSLLRL